jgi:hypothetical protein
LVSASTSPIDFSLYTVCPPDSQANPKRHAKSTSANDDPLRIVSLNFFGAYLGAFQVDSGANAQIIGTPFSFNPKLLRLVAGHLTHFRSASFCRAGGLIQRRGCIFSHYAELLLGHSLSMAQQHHEVPYRRTQPCGPDFQARTLRRGKIISRQSRLRSIKVGNI